MIYTQDEMYTLSLLCRAVHADTYILPVDMVILTSLAETFKAHANSTVSADIIAQGAVKAMKERPCVNQCMGAMGRVARGEQIERERPCRKIS